jgi:hypothetical protein
VTPKGGWHRKPTVKQAYTVLPQRNDHIQRFICENYTSGRLRLRTAGMVKERDTKFGFVGLGSVGSNLLHFCRSFEPSHYFLLDNDTLKVENIGRHLLGIRYIRQNKAKAIKSYLNEYRPEISIDAVDADLLSLVGGRFDKLNNCDLNFICIGDLNKEIVIAEAIASAILTKPCLFIWVEPYLAAGQVIYINPNDPKDYKSYFDEEGYYQFRILSKDNPKEKILKREAGCSSAFTPYSGPDLIQFLSCINPYIRELWIDFDCPSFRLSWIGNLEYLRKAEGLIIEPGFIEFKYNHVIKENL